MNKGPRPSRSRGGKLQALSAVMLGASKCVFDWKGLLWFCTWCVVDIVTLACTLLYVYLHFLYTPFAALWLSNSFYKMSKVTYLCQVRWVKTKVDHFLAYDRPKGFSRPIKPSTWNSGFSFVSWSSYEFSPYGESAWITLKNEWILRISFRFRNSLIFPASKIRDSPATGVTSVAGLFLTSLGFEKIFKK